MTSNPAAIVDGAEFQVGVGRGKPPQAAMRAADVDWPALAVEAAAMVGTPCYVLAAAPIQQAIAELDAVPCTMTRRYWLSMKTQPVKPLLELWRDCGREIEVVSEYELRAARSVGFAAEKVLVNGVAKHTWLHRHALPNLNVHFDSLGEVQGLLPFAKSLRWVVGIRCQPPDQKLPERTGWPDQFGMSPEECLRAVAAISADGMEVSGLHFHLGTNLTDHRKYISAIEHVGELAKMARCMPRYLDIGGGLPGIGAAAHLDAVFRAISRCLPTVTEVWLENGRFLSGRAGALVVRILDIKERRQCRHLICDGGRINHARPAAIERHEIIVHPPRTGPTTTTVVSGPTSANVDQLGIWDLPRALDCEDLIIWRDAGAYHLPLETRFSVGYAPVVWVDDRGTAVVARKRETAEKWWAVWE